MEADIGVALGSGEEPRLTSAFHLPSSDFLNFRFLDEDLCTFFVSCILDNFLG